MGYLEINAFLKREAARKKAMYERAANFDPRAPETPEARELRLDDEAEMRADEDAYESAYDAEAIAHRDSDHWR
ncbi:hypothetical protein EHF33_14140 [Deinococcus psychrotolerans]|uniref:Uncharacterized protein n=1 Tax=Deinococcus psychrotolerans TaxID=2489213 RepID=A0A3G8YGJ1_9DEIO|nr:hypothetical protein [Deinococcus psychrotolerans]AZI44055.1 hypothetical protein EHF33_14140 [Deinococcus psychrotolerans]